MALKTFFGKPVVASDHSSSEWKLWKTCRACTRKCLTTHSKRALSLNSSSFFKVMMGDFSSFLEIPSEFANQMKCQACTHAILEGPSGHLWHVILCCGNFPASFKDGWGNFVSDHCIDAGDILVFRHVVDTHFAVQIFGATGSEKQNSFSLQNYTSCCLREENLSTICNQKRCEHRQISTEAFISVEILFAVEHKRNGDAKFKSLTEDAKEITLNCREIEKMHRRTYTEVYSFSGGAAFVNNQVSVDVRDTIKLPEAELCISENQAVSCIAQSSSLNAEAELNKPFSSTYNHGFATDQECSPLSFELIQEKPSWRGTGVAPGQGAKHLRSLLTPKIPTARPPTRGGGDLCQQSPSTVTRKERKIKLESKKREECAAQRFSPDTCSAIQVEAHEAIKSVKSKNPLFCLVMSNSAVSGACRLNIPKTFAKHWSPKGKAVVTLLGHGNSGKWLAHFMIYERFEGLTIGWKRFVIGNKIKKGDICVFELVNRAHRHFKVHIFRLVEDSPATNKHSTVDINASEIDGSNNELKPVSQSHTKQSKKYGKDLSAGHKPGKSSEKRRKVTEKEKYLAGVTINDTCPLVWHQKLDTNILQHGTKYVHKESESPTGAIHGNFPAKSMKLQEMKQINEKKKEISRNIQTPLIYQKTNTTSAIKDTLFVTNQKSPKYGWKWDETIGNWKTHPNHKMTSVEVIEID